MINEGTTKKNIFQSYILYIVLMSCECARGNCVIHYFFIYFIYLQWHICTIILWIDINFELQFWRICGNYFQNNFAPKYSVQLWIWIWLHQTLFWKGECQRRFLNFFPWGEGGCKYVWGWDRKGDVLRDRNPRVHRKSVWYPRQNNVIYLYFENF